MMHLLPRKILVNITPLKKGGRLNNAGKPGQDSKAKHEPPSVRTPWSWFSSRVEYDWETLDDDETTMKCHAWETLTKALNRKDASDAIILVTLAKEFSTGCILHRAIELGVPSGDLILLATRLPFFLTQVDGRGRYPLHVACAFGASSEFVAYCIEKYPPCADEKDSDGNSPIQLLCQGTWADTWNVKFNPAAKKSMARIHQMLQVSAAIHEDDTEIRREEKLGRLSTIYARQLVSLWGTTS